MSNCEVCFRAEGEGHWLALHTRHLFREVSCSGCGKAFLIPGRTDGFSHCDNHEGYLAL
jgi:hypothetical protein